MFGYVSWSTEGKASLLDGYAQSLKEAGQKSVVDENVSFLARDAWRGEAVAVALDGRPRWGDDREATAEEIGLSYLRDGEQVLAELNGGFAVAIFDYGSKTLRLAIDRMGIEGLSWIRLQGGVLFSSSAHALAKGPGSTRSLRAQALYDYFFFHMVPAPTSVFEGVNKLEAAQLLRLTPNGISVSNYWRPSFDMRQGADVDALSGELHACIEAAVKATRPNETTGAFLSGGLDSSTVAGFLSRQISRPHTFSIGFGVAEYDESRFARISSTHFGCTAHEYQVTADDVVRAIPVVAREYDEPFGNSSAIPTYICARFAKENGMTRLLAGDGGDELFGGNERYARHKMFEWFRAIPRGLQKPLTLAIQSTLRGDIRVASLRKLRSYVDQALIPLPDRFESWNFVYREGARVMFEPDFAAEVDMEAPLRQMRDVFDGIASEVPPDGQKPDLLDRMLIYDWKFTLADNDLRKVGTMCAAAGVEVAFPMLDNRVVEMSLRVPTRLKMPGLKLRDFYRRSMKGFLSEATLAKRKKGFGLPFGVWLKDHPPLADLVYGSLSDLKRRHVIRASLLDQIIHDHRQGHPGYYGYIIWDLVILEEWLKCHSD